MHELLFSEVNFPSYVPQPLQTPLRCAIIIRSTCFYSLIQPQLELLSQSPTHSSSIFPFFSHSKHASRRDRQPDTPSFQPIDPLMTIFRSASYACCMPTVKTFVKVAQRILI